MTIGDDNRCKNVLEGENSDMQGLYVMARKLGEGEFGTVYSCTEISTGIEYACKSTPKRKLRTREDEEDLRREIQILKHLAALPNVVTFKGAYEDQSHVHIVMELCAGGDLFDRINLMAPYCERDAAQLTQAIVGAVEACHSFGVMHRDLKPENLLLVNKDDDFSLKISDFGLSSYFKPGQVFTEVVGTPYYIAPEVLSKHYGPEADIWSAGAIVYVLLSGEPPFWAETQQGILAAVSKGHIDFSSDPWPGISDSAKDLIRKMLCPQPSERLTAQEVLIHPWIHENVAALKRGVDPAVQSRVEQFFAMNKFKRMAFRVITESLAEEEIAGLREEFKAIDTDNSGDITFDELKAGWGKYDPHMKVTEIRDLMEEAEVGVGSISSFREFAAARVVRNKECEGHLVAAFRYFDKNGNGYITIDDLQLAWAEHNITDVFLNDIIREVDQDNDGKIDYQDFFAMMTEGNT